MPYSREQHYRIEKELASRLKISSSDERRFLYTEIYDELFRRVPDHPMLTRKVSESARLRYVQHQLKLLKSHLVDTVRFLEIGPGDCKLSFAVAEKVSHVAAVDVSNVITQSVEVPENFSLFISDGVSIPVDRESIDVAYSDQLVEHLHPEDAREHFRNVFRALRQSGSYICITPSRLSGPHDVSKYFEHEASGMHLKEYTYQELIYEFSRVGFSRFRCEVGSRGYYLSLPPWPLELLEKAIQRLPKRVARLPLIRTLLAVRLIALK